MCGAGRRSLSTPRPPRKTPKHRDPETPEEGVVRNSHPSTHQAGAIPRTRRGRRRSLEVPRFRDSTWITGQVLTSAVRVTGPGAKVGAGQGQSRVPEWPGLDPGNVFRSVFRSVFRRFSPYPRALYATLGVAGVPGEASAWFSLPVNICLRADNARHLRGSDNRERGAGASRRAVLPDLNCISRDLAPHANHAHTNQYSNPHDQ